MRVLLLALLALVLAGCYGGEPIDPERSSVRYWHDDKHGVSCWTAWESSITCLPDSEVQNPGN